MDDIKVYAKNEKQFESLVHIIYIISTDVGMEFVRDRKVCHVKNYRRKI